MQQSTINMDINGTAVVTKAVAEFGLGVGLDPAMDVNRPLAWLTYREIMLRFTTFTTGRSYDKTQIFRDNEFVAFLTPRIDYRFMAIYAYGRVNPSAEDNPISGCGTTSKYWKKTISYFMANKLQRWAYIGGVACGNPSKSTLVNNLLNANRNKGDERDWGTDLCR